MNISELSLRRPVLAIVMNIIIVVFGVIGFKSLGVRDYPAIDPPNINVRTSYGGANPDIIETQITEPLEKAINGIAGIKNITSSSNAGSSNINVEFELGIDLEAAANDVRDKVSQATRQLPADLVVASARELDPTRPLCFANVATAPPEADVVTDLFDLICVNRYFGWYVDTVIFSQVCVLGARQHGTPSNSQPDYLRRRSACKARAMPRRSPPSMPPPGCTEPS